MRVPAAVVLAAVIALAGCSQQHVINQPGPPPVVYGSRTFTNPAQTVAAACEAFRRFRDDATAHRGQIVMQQDAERVESLAVGADGQTSGGGNVGQLLADAKDLVALTVDPRWSGSLTAAPAVRVAQDCTPAP